MKKFQIENKLTIIDQKSIQLYLNDIRSDKSCKPLSKEDEITLFNEYKLTKDERVKVRILKAQLRWVVTIAKQYSYPKARFEDLLNEGNFGLIEAFEKYNVNLENRFATFATSYIRRSINNYIKNTLADVIQPANRSTVKKLINKAKSIYKLLGVDEPSDEQLIEKYNEIKQKKDLVLDIYLLNEIKNNSKDFISISSTLSINEDFTLEDTLKVGEEFNTDYNIVQSEKKERITNALNSILSTREVEIVEYMVGLNNKEQKTLEQIADILNLTRERTGQIYAKALKTLSQHKKLMFEILGSSKSESQKMSNNDSVINAKTYSN